MTFKTKVQVENKPNDLCVRNFVRSYYLKTVVLKYYVADILRINPGLIMLQIKLNAAVKRAREKCTPCGELK